MEKKESSDHAVGNVMQPSGTQVVDNTPLAGTKRPHPDHPPTPPRGSMSAVGSMEQEFGPGGVAVSTQEHVLVPRKTISSTSPLGANGRPFSSTMETLRASKRDLNWDSQYDALVAFANAHGHCNIRSGYSADNQEQDRSQINLYAWLALQRRHRKAGRLRKDREDKLEILVKQGKLTWSGNEAKTEEEDIVQPAPPPPPSWSSYFGALLAFVEDHGHAQVPLGHMYFVERRRDLDLGAWLKMQRQLASGGSMESSQKERLEVLVEGGLLSWTVPVNEVSDLPESVLDASWDLEYSAVCEYVQKHGNINVNEVGTVLTTSFGSRFDLSLWVHCQRFRYRLRVLKPLRLERLSELVRKGQFEWMSSEEAVVRAAEREKKRKEDDTLWNAWYNVLVWYGRHNGHCNLGATDTVSLPDESEAELGKWLDNQKKYLAKSKLQPDRAEKLRRLVGENKLPQEWIIEYPQLAQVEVSHVSGESTVEKLNPLTESSAQNSDTSVAAV